MAIMTVTDAVVFIKIIDRSTEASDERFLID
jgi:hypothetical protein